MSNETARRDAVNAYMAAHAERRSGNPRTTFLAGWDAAVAAAAEADDGPRASGWYNPDSDRLGEF